MPVKKSAKGLGKGLDSLIPATNIKEDKKKEAVEKKVDALEVLVNINKIEPNSEQPRKNFKEEAIEELSESIKQHGVIQPLLVQDRGDHYEIIAGERRWRAARKAGLKEVPVIIKNYTEQEIVEISLIENIQREDLNPIEEALAYKRLLNEFNLKQEELAERVAKNRTTIANSMRLLNLTEYVQQLLVDGTITQGHARALLAIEDKERQIEAANKIINDKMSVRDVEKYVKNMDKPVKEKKVTPEVLRLLHQEMENNMRSSMGAKVSIVPKDENKGKIEIEYNSTEELEILVHRLSMEE